MFDFDPWLRPLEGGNPSGESLRNDPRFHEIERLMQPRVEVVRDERNNPVAQNRLPVDWADVLRKAEDLRPLGRDLRLLVIVTRALANERGFVGLADGLTLIARSLHDHWPSLHPELRNGVGPRDAALRRLNALAQLQADPDGVLGDLRAIEAMAPRGVGQITGRDLERAVLSVQAVLAEAPSLATTADKTALAAAHDALLDRVGRGCRAQADLDAGVVAALLDGAGAASAALAAVEAALRAGIGAETAPALPDLARFLAGVTATLSRATAGPAAAAASAEPPPTAAPAPGAPAMAAAAAAPAAPGSFPDRLTSRDEVIRCLDLIIGFYDRGEPSSPIQHLARRMRRMVPMNFLELMEDLAPSGLKEFRLIAGVPDAGKPSQKAKGE